MTASLTIVHQSRLAHGAPDPRDRQLLRRVLALAASHDVTFVVTEPQLGSQGHPELDEAGIDVVCAPGCLAEALASCASVAVLATTVDIAQVVHRVRPDVALVVDLAALESTAITFDADDDPAEAPGLETMRATVRARERAVLEHASLVIAGSPTLARAVNAVAPAARVEVVAPAVPLADVRVLPSRPVIGFVGAYSNVRGSSAERVLATSLDECRDERDTIVAVGTDASVFRRALGREVCARAHGDVALATSDLAAAIVVGDDHTVTAELAGLGIPTFAADLEHPSRPWRAARALAEDSDAWQRASDAQRVVAEQVHDPTASHAAYLAVLARALPTAFDLGSRAGRPAPSHELPTWVAVSCAGSLAAQSPATEKLRAEAQPPPILRWQHALYTNLDLAPDDAYRRWLRVHHDVTDRARVIAARAERVNTPSLLSIVLPVHDTDPSMLRAAIESVRAQLYQHWQLCIADDASTNSATLAVLQALEDPRIDVVRLDEGGGISAASNAAIERALGSYVAFLDHDDTITPDALYWIARAIELEPRADIVYSDEDKLDDDGRRCEPFFKPDWSPDLLLSCNYITHFLAVRTSLLRAVGGLRSALDGAQDYDLLLRLTERTDAVVHVPKPLYSWRKSPTSTAADIGAKPHAHAASRRAVEETLDRRGLAASRAAGIDPTWHRVRHRIAHRPEVTVVIPTRDRVDLLEPCIDLLRSNVGHRPLELLIVDNESGDPATLAYLDGFDRRLGRVVRYPHRFNYARQMNLAAIEAGGEVLLLLNNDARPLGTDWFDAMLEHAIRPEIGAVGARLRFPDGRPQHEGVVLNAGGVALNLDAGPYAVMADNIRDVAAVTGACLMVRRSVWQAVGGMDERLRVAYNDVDLCLRIGERGWRNLYTPVAELTHAESSTRGSLHPEADELYYQRRWGVPQTCADPFFTTSLELLHPFSPRL